MAAPRRDQVDIAGSQVVYVTPQPSLHRVQSKPGVNFSKLHYSIGIVFILFGSASFVLELIGVSLISPYIGHTLIRPYYSWENYYSTTIVKISLYGSGIWGGLFILATGLLQYFAGKKKSRCCLVASLVMDIVTFVAVTSSIILASLELTQYRPRDYEQLSGYTNAAKFNTAKGSVVIFTGCFVIILTLVHSGFVCYDTGFCCLRYKSKRGPQSATARPKDSAVVYMFPPSVVGLSMMTTPVALSPLLVPHSSSIFTYEEANTPPPGYENLAMTK